MTPNRCPDDVIHAALTRWPVRAGGPWPIGFLCVEKTEPPLSPSPSERWKLRLAYQCEIINLNFAFAKRKVKFLEERGRHRMKGEWDCQTEREWEKGKSNSICCIWGIYLSLGACQEQLSERQQTKQNERWRDERDEKPKLNGELTVCT